MLYGEPGMEMYEKILEIKVLTEAKEKSSDEADLET